MKYTVSVVTADREYPIIQTPSGAYIMGVSHIPPCVLSLVELAIAIDAASKLIADHSRLKVHYVVRPVDERG